MIDHAGGVEHTYFAVAEGSRTAIHVGLAGCDSAANIADA